ncbi:MAG TPA: hypothetical protein DEP53_03000 [Bacteroidetes bacterium]|nr:hypothetical protein [Bacteroidota bacterium]
MKPLFALMLLAIAHSGCSSSYFISSEQGELLSCSQFNTAVKDKKATIIFQDDSTVDAQEVWAVPDSISWLHSTNDARKAVAMHKIKKVVFKDRLLGVLEGAGIGLISGGAVGFFVSAGESGGRDGFLDFGPELPAGIGAGAGLLLGTIVGATLGHTYNYEFYWSQSSDSSRRIQIEKSSTNTDVLCLKSSRFIRGTIREILVENPSTKTHVLYVNNGSIIRRRVNADIEDGKHLKRVTIRNEEGEDRTYDASEIIRIEIAD